MRAIARDAGVGIATLYRHYFPTRESLVDAVYQVQRITAGAVTLLKELPPAQALSGRPELSARRSFIATLFSE